MGYWLATGKQLGSFYFYFHFVQDLRWRMALRPRPSGYTPKSGLARMHYVYVYLQTTTYSYIDFDTTIQESIKCSAWRVVSKFWIEVMVIPTASYMILVPPGSGATGYLIKSKFLIPHINIVTSLQLLNYMTDFHFSQLECFSSSTFLLLTRTHFRKPANFHLLFGFCQKSITASVYLILACW